MTKIRNMIPWILMLFSLRAMALSSDQHQQAYFRSDQMTYYLHNQQVIYSGHAQITQGSTHISGEKIIVFTNHKSHGISDLTITGQPAHYQTLPDQSQKKLTAHAKKIHYNAAKHSVVLTGRAVVHQPPNSLASKKIWYDIKKNQARTSIRTTERTTIYLGPQGKQLHHG